MAATSARDELLTLIDDYHSFNVNLVPLLPYPTSVDFCRQVSRGLPCVYSISQCLPIGNERVPRIPPWPATSWTREAFIGRVNEPVEVAVTPDGRADALCQFGPSDENVFLQPATVMMSMEKLFEMLCPGDTEFPNISPVYYLQSQNGNLSGTPLEGLLSDLPTNFDFAEAVLGAPDASNIWIGNEKSVTSTHRDPYENLYLVIKGSKTFTLWAPVDEIAMDAQMVRTGRYEFDSSANPPSFSIILDEEGKIPWVPVDPHLSPAKLNRKHPLYRYAQPRTVTVTEGQMLYLPAGWYHHVSQRCGVWGDGSSAPCIAVNYWYDQDYEGEKYVFRQLISRLVDRSRSNS